MRNKPTFENTINFFAGDKETTYNKYFENFVAGCIKDLKEFGITYCFTKEQVKRIKEAVKEVEIRKDREDTYILILEE